MRIYQFWRADLRLQQHGQFMAPGESQPSPDSSPIWAGMLRINDTDGILDGNSFPHQTDMAAAAFKTMPLPVITTVRVTPSSSCVFARLSMATKNIGACVSTVIQYDR